MSFERGMGMPGSGWQRLGRRAGPRAGRFAGLSARIFSALFAVACLGGCLLGPWNLTPQDQTAKVQVEVSLLLVQGRPFDTLWLERPLVFASGYDSSVAFIDSTASAVRVVRTDVAPAETVVYRMIRPDTRAWLPAKPDTVRRGGHYRLEASLRWDAARDYPQQHEFHTDSVTAETYVQSRYAIRDTALLPLEALHPTLSLGLPPQLVSLALSDSGVLGKLYDSLEALRSLSRIGVDKADLRTYLQGGLVRRPIKRGDTAFYIFDATQVVDPNPANPDPISRFARGWSFLQDFDPQEFGGVSVAYSYDTSRARILDPLQQELRAAFGRTDIDTAGLYQRGSTRFLGVTGKIDPGVKGYPDTVAWSNRNLGYTGRDVIYFYAVDSQFVAYENRANPALVISLGGFDGGGRRRTQSNVHFTGIHGGDGYFAAAALDSFAVNLIAVKDTIPVPLIHAASLLEDARRGSRGD